MNIRVVLVEPEQEGNIGSIARLMKNFGLSKLWLVKPQVELGNEAYSRAVHAQEILLNTNIVNGLEEALTGVPWIIGTTAIVAKKPSNLRRTAITVEELTKRISYRNEKIAILFGREGRGLSNQELDKCDVLVSIPSCQAYRTLNVASSSAIIFYELWKAKTTREKGYVEEASAEDRKRLLQFFNILVEKASLPEHKNRLANKAFQNIISRAFISKREVSLLMGVLRRLA